jgi:hypothetical protein
LDLKGENGPLNEIGCHCDPKRHFLDGAASFEAGRVKIGPPTRPVRLKTIKTKRNKKNTRATTLAYWRSDRRDFVLSPDVINVINCAKYDLDRSSGFCWRIRQKRHLPLEAFIAHTTLPFANAPTCE